MQEDLDAEWNALAQTVIARRQTNEDEAVRAEAHARRLEIERLYDAQPRLFADVRHFTTERAIVTRAQTLRAQIEAASRLEPTPPRQRRLRRLSVEYRLLQHKLVFCVNCPLQLLPSWMVIHGTETRVGRHNTDGDKRVHTLILLNAMLLDKTSEEIVDAMAQLQRAPQFP